MMYESASSGCTRRAFMQGVGVGSVMYLVGCKAPARAGDPGGRLPNIVVILADDLGWADVGYHGSAIRTPHIDRLAEQGLRLEQHYVMPTCTPTRVGLITGRYPSRFGVTAPAYGKIFDDDTLTLPGMLKGCGYHTAISGKWHMGSPPQETPRKYGFDESYGYFHGQIDPYTHHYKNGEPSWHRDDRLLDETGHATDLITDEAVRVIKTSKTRAEPFFLYVAYNVPHYPLDEPQVWLDMYPNMQPASRRWYAAAVSHMDAGIGRILDALERTGQAEDTLVLFVSDNGGQKSWHSTSQYDGRYADKPHTVLGDNRPWRGWKGDVYEGGIRVPAIIRWPGRLPTGRCDAPIHIVDWMPTLAGIVGVTPVLSVSADWDGCDIRPVLEGRSDDADRTLYWKTPGARAIRQGDWKLIVYNKGDAELYNLADDPYERNNRVAEEPDRTATMRRTLEAIAKADR